MCKFPIRTQNGNLFTHKMDDMSITAVPHIYARTRTFHKELICCLNRKYSGRQSMACCILSTHMRAEICRFLFYSLSVPASASGTNAAVECAMLTLILNMSSHLSWMCVWASICLQLLWSVDGFHIANNETATELNDFPYMADHSNLFAFRKKGMQLILHCITLVVTEANVKMTLRHRFS